MNDLDIKHKNACAAHAVASAHAPRTIHRFQPSPVHLVSRIFELVSAGEATGQHGPALAPTHMDERLAGQRVVGCSSVAR